MENPHRAFKRLSNKYERLFLATKHFYDDQKQKGVRDKGHGFDHDLFVAQIGYLISGDCRIGECAWVAGLLHSIDRHCEGLHADPNTTKILINVIIRARLKLVSDLFDREEIEMILAAVENHSEPNRDSDNAVTVALKDADRLANFGPLVIFRGAQQRPNIPAGVLETMGQRHPKTSFRNPASCYDALFFNLEWEAMLRLPKAKRMARPYFAFIRQFMDLALAQQKEIGLVPFP